MKLSDTCMYYRIKRTPLPVRLSPAEIYVSTFVHNDLKSPHYDIKYPHIICFRPVGKVKSALSAAIWSHHEKHCDLIFTLSQIVKKNWCDIKQCVLKVFSKL